MPEFSPVGLLSSPSFESKANLYSLPTVRPPEQVKWIMLIVLLRCMLCWETLAFMGMPFKVHHANTVADLVNPLSMQRVHCPTIWQHSPDLSPCQIMEIFTFCQHFANMDPNARHSEAGRQQTKYKAAMGKQDQRTNEKHRSTETRDENRWINKEWRENTG